VHAHRAHGQAAGRALPRELLGVLFGRLSKRGAELQEINTKLEEELAERRKIQAELEKAMELAKAAAIAKDQFLASVSHEIRTPLNAIIGMTGLLLDTQLTETQHEWLHLIDLSGNALLALVSTYLARLCCRQIIIFRIIIIMFYAQMIFLTWQRWKAGG
jgi:signal transduction histidine kinase